MTTPTSTLEPIMMQHVYAERCRALNNLLCRDNELSKLLLHYRTAETPDGPLTDGIRHACVRSLLDERKHIWQWVTDLAAKITDVPIEPSTEPSTKLEGKLGEAFRQYIMWANRRGISYDGRDLAEVAMKVINGETYPTTTGV